MLKLKNEGKSYNQIAKILGCTQSNVSYHCSPDQKQKTIDRNKKNKKAHPYYSKLNTYLYIKYNKPKEKTISKKKQNILLMKILYYSRDRENNKLMKALFTVQDVLNKFGEHPKCYLTGEDIDISKPKTYHFDHKIPVSRGGDNSLENLGICTKEANFAKRDMTVEEFYSLCEKVIAYKNK